MKTERQQLINLLGQFTDAQTPALRSAARISALRYHYLLTEPQRAELAPLVEPLLAEVPDSTNDPLLLQAEMTLNRITDTVLA